MTREDFNREAAALMEQYLARPLLRGVSHVVAAAAALAGLLVLVLEAGAALQIVASAIYGAGLTASLGVSALYHRVKWRPRAYLWIRKLDHSMIFVLIASSYTPILLLAVHSSWKWWAVAIVWVVAGTAVIVRLSVPQLPRPVMVSLGIVLGWCGLALFPTLHAVSDTALILVATSGVLYTLGAIVYLTKRPNPLPRVFGFHEIFHAFVVLAATLHFIAVWPLVTA
jgi:hemolysin III